MNIYKRLLRYILPYKVTLSIAMLLMVASALGDVMVSGVIYVTTNGLMNRDVVSLGNIPHLPEKFAVDFSVAWIPLIIVFVFLFRGAVSFFSKYLMSIVGLKSVRDIRNDLFQKVTTLSCDYFSTKHSGDLMSRIVGDVNNVQNAITMIILDVIKSPLTIIFTIPIVFVMGGKLAWFSVIVFPLVAIPIIILGRKLRKLTKRFLERNADITSFLQEALIGMKIVKAFNAERLENKRFREITQSLYDFSRKAVRATEVQRPVIEIMGAVGIGLAIFFALKTLSMDRFMTFAGSLYFLYEPAKKLSKINVTIQQTIASGKRIFEIMDAKSSVPERENAREFNEPVESIGFENVSFAYDQDNFVLRDISLEVKKGESVALVGASGSGKTTLVSLLPRFYDPNSGRIVINHEDIRNITLKSLRDCISIVSQDTILFRGTIKENILYGKIDATDGEVINAAKMANAHDFISQFPKGYETNIGERGLALSGGQRQRLSIARAVIKNPPILIFDEATSHLDTESEREVQKAIENLMQGRTVFVIAHRLSTVQNADRILVMENGKIVEIGTHEELLNKDGVYRRLYEMQFNV